MSICENLIEIGFPADSLKEDEDFFGNIIIQSHLDCGSAMTLIRDRGIWECTVHRDVPLVAVIYLLQGTPFSPEDFAFHSDSALVKWLSDNQPAIQQLTQESIAYASKKWKRKKTTWKQQ